MNHGILPIYYNQWDYNMGKKATIQQILQENKKFTTKPINRQTLYVFDSENKLLGVYDPYHDPDRPEDPGTYIKLDQCRLYKCDRNAKFKLPPKTVGTFYNEDEWTYPGPNAPGNKFYLKKKITVETTRFKYGIGGANPVETKQETFLTSTTKVYNNLKY